MEFSAYLRAFRFIKGLSASSITKAGGPSHSIISRLESGERFPTRANIQLLVVGMKLSTREATLLYIHAGYIPPHYEALLKTRTYALDRLDELVATARIA